MTRTEAGGTRLCAIDLWRCVAHWQDAMWVLYIIVSGRAYACIVFFSAIKITPCKHLPSVTNTLWYHMVRYPSHASRLQQYPPTARRLVAAGILRLSYCNNLNLLFAFSHVYSLECGNVDICSQPWSPGCCRFVLGGSVFPLHSIHFRSLSVSYSGS